MIFVTNSLPFDEGVKAGLIRYCWRLFRFLTVAGFCFIGLAVLLGMQLSARSDKLQLPRFVGQFSIALVLWGFVWNLFGQVERILSEDTKRDVSAWLALHSLTVGERWPQTFRIVAWFSHNLDTEKHPLQILGLALGGIVAFIYWIGVHIAWLF
jgi:hypothetical protein